MKKEYRAKSLPLALFIGVVLSAPAQSNPNALDSGPVQVAVATPSGQNTAAAKAIMRDLWVGHIFWVRNVVFETFANNESAAEAAEAEVVANARQIGDAIEPFYGKPAADKLFTLLAGH